MECGTGKLEAGINNIGFIGSICVVRMNPASTKLVEYVRFVAPANIV